MKNELLDGGQYRLVKLTKDLNQKIKTVAIISAENPRLEKSIIGPFYGYSKLKGNSDGFGNSLMVNNITKPDALMFASKHQQATIIYGKRFEETRQYGITFQLITSFKCYDFAQIGEILGERTVFINKENPEDFFSELKGCNFQIPLFDEEIGLSGTYNYVNATWKGGKIARSHYIPHPENLSPEDENMIERLIEKSLLEGKMLKWGWMRRCAISNILKKYSL
jgi:hypothetical protein